MPFPLFFFFLPTFALETYPYAYSYTRYIAFRARRVTQNTSLVFDTVTRTKEKEKERDQLAGEDQSKEKGKGL